MNTRYILKNFGPDIKYGGTVPYKQSMEVLKSYDALLFPTYWVGECFPGTIVDAFCAGLPVLASDWNSNGEIIKQGVTGFLYPSEYGENLIDLMKRVIVHPEILKSMRKNCRKEAALYSPEINIPKIISFMEEKK